AWPWQPSPAGREGRPAGLRTDWAMRMSVHHGLTDQRGFPLAEVLVAAVIITLALVALASVVPIAGYAVQDGNQMSTATFLAEQQLEQPRTCRGSGRRRTVVSAPPPRPPRLRRSPGAGHGLMARTTTTPAPPTPR